jgi:hypothetical protein
MPTLPAGPTMLVPTRLASHKSVIERHLVLQHGVRSTRRAGRSRLWVRIYRVVATSAEESRRVRGAGGTHGTHAIQLPLEPILLPLHQRRVNALLRQRQSFYLSFSPFLGWRPFIGLLYQPRMLMDGDECGAVGAMNSTGNRSTRRKPSPVPLCPPQIPHDLTRARTRSATTGSRRLTA